MSGADPTATLELKGLGGIVENYLKMVVLDILIATWMAAGCIYWIAVLYLTVRAVRAIPLLERMPDPEREDWPAVSAILVLRDEAESLDGPVRQILEDGYPRLELVLVDNLSSDATLELMDSLSASDGRVKAVRVDDIPGGWLARIYAMERGCEESAGEWIAFISPRVKVKPGAIAKAVDHCEAGGLDYLAVIPELYRRRAFLDSISQVLLRVMLISEKAWRAADKGEGAAIGSSSFALVRRSALERAGGLAEVRMEPSEDVAVAQLIKGSGGRCGAVNGRGYVSGIFYRSLREAAVEMERGVWASLGAFSLARVFSLALLFFALEFGPYLFFIPMGIPYGELVGTAVVTLSMIVSMIVCRWLRIPLAAASFFPIDLLVVVYMVLRAGVVCASRGGIIWQGDFYPTEMLSMGRRFRFP